MPKTRETIENLYFIALLPKEPVYQEINDLKQIMWERYETKAALRSPPHITLHMPFKLKLKRENELEVVLDTLAMDVNPFNTELRGFGCFEPRVIYVDVIQSRQLQDLKQRIDEKMKSIFNLFNNNYKNQPYHPHVTIAFRDLRKRKFYEAWSEFNSKSYQATFHCDTIYLLKHNGKYWTIQHESHMLK